MQERVALGAVFFWSLWSVFFGDVLPLQSQTGATLRGTVTLKSRNTPVAGVSVLVVELGESTQTDAKGIFEFTNLAPRSYTVMAHSQGLGDTQKMVLLKGGRSEEHTSELQSLRHLV